ncbi:hypothetical protein ACH4UR_37245 [Streptomyces lydicus]|uniref:hypothetical protein n=1 Tax=Streptomyces lydicus TaxID=47763 RepID=UPI0033C8DBB1
MTTRPTPPLAVRTFTFEGQTFFITPEIHNGLLRMWRLESLVANINYPHYSTTLELHNRCREVAEAFGLTRTEWPADWPKCGGYHDPEPARARNRRTVLALARAYSEATEHLIYRSACYSGCVAHLHCIGKPPETCRVLDVPCRCFLQHPPKEHSATT